MTDAGTTGDRKHLRQLIPGGLSLSLGTLRRGKVPWKRPTADSKRNRGPRLTRGRGGKERSPFAKGLRFPKKLPCEGSYRQMDLCS